MGLYDSRVMGVTTMSLNKSFPKITGITLSDATKSLAVDAEFTLTTTIAPTDTTQIDVVWSSDKESIATVSSSGEVTAVAVGSAVITCKSVHNTSIFATCKVTVA